jgi:hypothetical protein
VSLALYMDVQVPAGITRALRRQGVDVLTAQEDGAGRFSDPKMLDRAAELGRIVFTRDADFLAEGVRRQRAGLPFATIVYAHQQSVSIGRCVADLALVAFASTADEVTGQVVHLPL